MIGRLGQLTLFATALIEAASATRLRLSENEDPFTSKIDFGDDDAEDSLENSNERSEALYYDPENQVIYEVTMGDEATSSNVAPTNSAVKPASSVQDTISAEPGNLTADEMVALGLLEELPNEAPVNPANLGLPSNVKLISNDN